MDSSSCAARDSACQLNQKFRARKVSASSERILKGAGRFLQPRPLSRAETFSHTVEKDLSKTRLDLRRLSSSNAPLSVLHLWFVWAF